MRRASSVCPPTPTSTAKQTYGVRSYQLSIGPRWRQSAAVAFLRPALARPNLTVTTAAHATRIMLEGRRAIGVEWLRGGKADAVRADREVILSAGAVQSPQLLQLSGIGPAQLLRQHGIPVAVDLPGVGENLQDHYQARTIVRLKARNSLNDDVRNPIRLAHMGWEWLAHGRGPLTVGAGQVGGAACTQYARNGRPDIQFNVMPLSVDKPGDPLHRYSGFTASLRQCHPRSRDRIVIRSADALDALRIEPRYLSAEIDIKVVVAGIRVFARSITSPHSVICGTGKCCRGCPHKPIGSFLISPAPMAARCSMPPAPAAWVAIRWP
jgi:choline dehydrogenase-like flavoprotein